MWRGSLLRLFLLLPCSVVSLHHQGRVQDGGTDQNPNLAHPRPGHSLPSVHTNSIAAKTDGGKDGVRGNGREEHVHHPHSGPLGEDLTAMETPRASTPVPNSPPWKARWFGAAESHWAALRGLHNKLLKGWATESGPGQEDRTYFGVCPGPDAKPSGPVSTLSSLAEQVADEGNTSTVHFLHPSKERWGGEEERNGSQLTLYFLPPPLSLTQPASDGPLLLFFLGPVGTEPLGVSFTSNSLHPRQQTACISPGTQYIVLRGRRADSCVHCASVWRVAVEIDQAEKGPGLHLSELQELLMGGGAGRNVTLSPLLLVPVDGRTDELPDRSRSLDCRETLRLSHPTAMLGPSGSFLFLCELQKFLTEVLPQKQLGSHPGRDARMNLDSLLSLPPLTLGSSSSETLLLSFLNSSALTLFSFPHQTSELRQHRVEIALQPHLLSVLKLRLEEAVAQMVKNEVGGRGARDRLSRLQEFSKLPKEGEEPRAGVGNPSERQYHALLLLKALQTVLRAWEVERGQRAARGGHKGIERGFACRLHALTVSLEKYLLNPPTATINNCHGVCGFPLANGNNHAFLLNSHHQKGLPLERPPCCVPVEYEDLQVVELDSVGTKISIKPNMVAKECGCR